jgi:hypothetical protein
MRQQPLSELCRKQLGLTLSVDVVRLVLVRDGAVVRQLLRLCGDRIDRGPTVPTLRAEHKRRYLTDTQASAEVPVRDRRMRQHPRLANRNPAPHSSPGRSKLESRCSLGPNVRTCSLPLGSKY